MESNGPVLLPIGIVINTSNIYDEVASYTVIPSHKVHQYWHVYTTTNKKLKDPTNRRLENFWWHVWGSDRSKLSGRALAKIFQDISLGPTVIPLREPSNSWTASHISPPTAQKVVRLAQDDRLPQAPTNISSIQITRPSPTTKTTTTTSSSKSLSRIATPHSILKNPSRLPTAGPRLAAHFNSPHESPDEASDDESNSSVTEDLSSCDSNVGSSKIHSNLREWKANNNSRNNPSRGATEVAPHKTSTPPTPRGYQETSQRKNKFSTSKSYASNHTRSKEIANGLQSKESSVNKQHILSRSNFSSSLFTAPTSSTSKFLAQGTIIEESGGSRSILSSTSPSQLSLDAGYSPPAYMARQRNPHRMPTLPTNSESSTLGRSRSQLALLLATSQGN